MLSIISENAREKPTRIEIIIVPFISISIPAQTDCTKYIITKILTDTEKNTEKNLFIV
jgi:hypothetical protein